MSENKKYAQELQSSDHNKVIASIEKIRRTGNTGLLKDVLSLLCCTKDENIKQTIMNLLDDLKDESVSGIIVESINNKDFLQVKSELISSCWKSGLNFTDNLGTFMSILITDELTIAIEAYSVLENNISELNKTQAKKHTVFLKSKLQDLPPERKALASDILEMLIGRM